MSATSDAFDAAVSEHRERRRYIDKFNSTSGNPLASVTPTVDADFFPTEVCNVICFTGTFVYDEEAVAESISQIAEAYEDFPRYEVHLIIDEDEFEEDEQALDELDEDLTALINDNNAGSIGIFYWGPLGGSSLRDKINQILSDFYGRP